jgi:peptidyl-prolyl cis-trans isomerase C
MQPTFFRLTLALMVGALSLPGLALAKGETASAKVATVNGVAIPKSEVDAIMHAQEAQGQKDTPQLRAAIRDRLITLQVIAQEAKRKGLNRNSDVVAEMEIARANILAQAYHADFLKHHVVSDDELKAEYEKIKANAGTKEYKASHILVDTEDEAKSIIAKLNKGAKFADLAKASKDAGSRDKGGELDWNRPSGYVKPFADALVKLKKGQFTETPVHTQFGWHVIKLDDVRPAVFPDFKDVKPRLEQHFQEEAFNKEVAALRAKAKIQ